MRSTPTHPAQADQAPDAALGRRRMKPGERRLQILQTLAAMLERPGAQRITTATLAGELQVSEAALYRHFASKAQMFEGLIDFIETSVMGLTQQIAQRHDDPLVKARTIVVVLLQFAERNPGMCRVIAGDALVHEDDRLQQRINQFLDRIESQLRGLLREVAAARGDAMPTVSAQVHASVLTAFAMGRLQAFARSRFKRLPTEQLDLALAMVQ